MADGGVRVAEQPGVVETAARLLSRRHVDAWAVLGYARMPRHIEATLRVYALQDWQRWPTIERAVVAGMPSHGYGAQAANDAMQRVLWRKAEISQDDRAWQLGVRAADYRQATRNAEQSIRAWLHAGAVAYLRASRDGFPPTDRHTECVALVRTPSDRAQAA